MNAVSFPISREAALCGVYIYSSSTRVGLKRKEELRSDYLRMYEDNYRKDLERRRARRQAVVEPAEDTVCTPSSFLNMLGNVPSKVQKPEIVIDIDLSITSLGAMWEEPKEVSKPITVSKPVASVPIDWVAKGTELFSIQVSSTTPKVQPTASSDVLWDEPDEFWDESEEEFCEEPKPEELFSSQTPTVEDPEEYAWDSVEDEDDIWVPEDTDSPEPVVPKPPVSKDTGNSATTVVPAVPKPPVSESPKYIPTTYAEVKTAPKVVQPKSVSVERLDENAIRDFVKANKLCSEGDILSAFSAYDKTKVRSVIKSALRKYRIFEKHGKYTV